MNLPLYIVDAFAAHAFEGNPASVCLLNSSIDDTVMQNIAMEMNHSETAFLLRTQEKPWNECSHFSLGWFTPKVEVDLCGHATLAAAAALFSEVKSTENKLTFKTRSGDLTVVKKQTALYEMEFPANPPKALQLEDANILSIGQILGLSRVMDAAGTNTFLLLRVSDDADLSSLAPDFSALKNAKLPGGAHGVIVTRKGPLPYDFSSRMFAPAWGINEDPVTGAAHTVLGPYWKKILNKEIFSAFQTSPRGGKVGVSLLPNGRVALTGSAVTVLSGELQIQET